MFTSDDTDTTTSLLSQVESLKNRVKELQEENTELATRLSQCCCQQMRERSNGSESRGGALTNENGEPVRSSNKSRKKKGYGAGSIEHLPRRYVALRIMYFGKRFYGFASEAQLDPTVESELFKALQQTRLLVGDKKKAQYSRCGRTDKGVSSVAQVIALFLRSHMKNTSERDEVPHNFGLQIDGEIDYVRVLNRVLPKDIRVTGWCPVPVDFSARFSCLSREYKYYFWRNDMNISAMQHAAQKFIGEHDFRNFCKMDAANVHNYKRHISSFELSPCDKGFQEGRLWIIRIKGSAFLWHQVRCMVAVLFMIGKGLESSEVIDVLLDIDKTPRKPQYTMAPEIPLVLQSCQFEGLKFTCSSEAGQALCQHLEDECRGHALEVAMHHEALLTLLPPDHNRSSSSEIIMIKKTAPHFPLMSRPTEPSYEERRAKLSQRNKV